MWSTEFLVNVAPAGNEATCRFKDVGGIIDALENDVVAHLNMMEHYQMKMKHS